MAWRQKLNVGEARFTGNSTLIAGTTVSVLQRNLAGDVLACSGTTIPRGAGFAKGCIFYKTDASAGDVGAYFNSGTSTYALFKSVSPGGRVELFEDFHADAGSTLPKPWGVQETSVSTNPTEDYVADAAGGQFALTLSADNEVQAITLYAADQLTFDPSKGFIFETRLKVEPDVTGAGGVFAAGDKFVFGMASARNATLDNITLNAWFMLAGANMNVYCETDDGTDNDDNDTTFDYVANTFYTFTIDATTLETVKFLINGTDYTPEAMTMAAAAANMQPFLEIQKAAAANKDHRVTIDYVYVSCGR